MITLQHLHNPDFYYDDMFYTRDKVNRLAVDLD